MKADLSRVTFRPEQHFSRVLQQQGRPMLDADWNEQVAILHHRIQMLAGDLMGSDADRCGAPFQLAGFEVRPLTDQADNFAIGAGRYYIDGLCCECEHDTSFTQQPLGAPATIDKAGISLIYLEAWESVVTPIDDVRLLEPALSGLETTYRLRVNWRVKAHRLSETHNVQAPDHDALRKEADEILTRWRSQPRGLLRARLAEPLTEAGRRPTRGERTGHFRGAENLLYRVEVHKGGPVGEATFKWSRENGATLLPLASLAGGSATPAVRARSAAAAIPPGCWLEVSDTVGRALSRPEPLVRMGETGRDGSRFTLTPAPASQFDFEPGQRTDVAIRVWNQASAPEPLGGEVAGPNGLPIVEGDHDAHWLDLEDGIQVQFLADPKQAHHYRAGDYWLIPARTADEGTLLRPREADKPDGVIRHYAPLGLFVPQSAAVIADYRQSFQPLAALQDQVNTLSAALDDLTTRVAAIEGR